MHTPVATILADAPARLVRRRTVLFIGGFDPRGPAFYQGLYRRACERPAPGAILSAEASVRRSPGPFLSSWQVSAETTAGPVATDYVFLRWDDIVRRHWPRGLLRMWPLTFRAPLAFLRAGVLRRILAESWPTFICGTLPAALTLALFLVSAAAGIAAGILVARMTGHSSWAIPAMALAVALPLSVYGTRALDGKYWLHLLTRSYAFTVLQADRRTPKLDERLSYFAGVLVERVRAGTSDEVLLVGHSSGAHVAVSILARALALDPEFGRRGTVLSFMTLGQAIPMLSWWPQAGWFREELQRVANEPALVWIDFTFPQDGACFAFTDPVLSSGLSHPAGAVPKPKLLSLQLYKLLPPEEFNAIRRQWYRMHLQYLNPIARPGEYDYLAMTAGPTTLADRFAHREPVRGFDRFKLRVFAP